MVIAVVYGVPFFGLAARISAGPAWINSLDLGYDIEATAVKDAAFDRFSASGARFSGSSGSPLIPAWTRNHLSLTQRRLMNTRRMALILAGLAICSEPAFTQIPSDTEIHKILAERVGAENNGTGIVVGVVTANSRRIASYGNLAKSDPRKLDGDTVFEIGSMTKVFTSLVLMGMVRRGEVALTDPISKYLPGSARVPERNGRNITFADLSTQSSGLPRMPTNFTPKDENNPYADYTVQQMYDFLSSYKLTRDIGSQYEYSNLGVGLLGHVLSLRAGMSYEALVRSRVCDPLGLRDTRVTLTPEMKARLAVGHNGALAPVENWDIPTLAGAGAVRSTANDMLTFLAANLGFVKTPLAQDMANEVAVRRSAGAPDMEIAYAWHIQTKDGNSIIWHNGGTGGYRSYMGYDPKAHVGVVVLANISTPAGVDDIGRHLLNATYPLLKVEAPAEHKQITLDTTTLDRYIGQYQLGPNAIITMSRDNDRFYTQLTGQPKFEVFAESERKFFLKVVDAQLTFDVDAQGAATQVTLHQNGRDLIAKRMNDADIKRAAEESAAIAKRFKDQTQSPGTEAALRRNIEELQRGEPNYDQMSPQLADITRQQLPQLKATMAQLGALQSVTFTGVGPGGADIYQVKFEHGTTEWRIMLGSNGKTVSIGFRPI
jgi:CubicO group peptidase (beta-lactamase class C family)